jgi:hypothetical protein
MLKATSSIVNVSQITGVLPVVNGGTGVTTSTGTGNTVLSAAPTLSGNVTLSTGNLIVASGQGIDFSATSGTGTSELLADYEEGIWTPTDTSGAGLTLTNNGSQYTKIGRAVTINFEIVWPVTANANNVAVSLPFNSGGSNRAGMSAFSNVVGEVNIYTPGGANFNLFDDIGTSITNATMSGKYLIVSLTYFV